MRAYDPDPSQIEAPLVRRDQVYGSQDFFAVYLDPVRRISNKRTGWVPASAGTTIL